MGRQVSGEKRDCQHPIARHEHGTRNAYVCDRCRCRPCRSANTAAERARNRAKLYGRYGGLVDAEPVRAHVRELQAAGIGLQQIFRVSRVGGGVLTKLMYGTPRPDGTVRPPSRRVTPRVAERILAVTVADLAPSAIVDGTGTTRRLQALVTVGWSQSALARALGMSPVNFTRTIRSPRVLASTAAAVRVLYDRLWDTPPAHDTHRERIAYARARSHAAKQGWLPPLAWDDDTIDDPAADPWHPETAYVPAAERPLDEIAIQEAMRGRRVHLTPAEKAEAVARMTARGISAAKIAERLGVTPRSVIRRRSAA